MRRENTQKNGSVQEKERCLSRSGNLPGEKKLKNRHEREEGRANGFGFSESDLCWVIRVFLGEKLQGRGDEGNTKKTGKIKGDSILKKTLNNLMVENDKPGGPEKSSKGFPILPKLEGAEKKRHQQGKGGESSKLQQKHGSGKKTRRSDGSRA